MGWFLENASSIYHDLLVSHTYGNGALYSLISWLAT